MFVGRSERPSSSTALEPDGSDIPASASLVFGPDASSAFKTSMSRLAKLLDTTLSDESRLLALWPQMRGIKKGLDGGKPIVGAGKKRGLPLALAVRMLKASWHADGTWPIGEHAALSLAEAGQRNVKSGPAATPDPDPQQVAEAYRLRGVDVAEEEKVSDDGW